MSFRSDCVQCAAHLISKMPLTILNKKTPFEMLYSKAPSYEMLKSFGRVAYASTLKRERSKLDPRARPCIFIGYAHSKKGYKLYDLNARMVFVSKNVQFHEKNSFHITVVQEVRIYNNFSCLCPV